MTRRKGRVTSQATEAHPDYLVCEMSPCGQPGVEHMFRLWPSGDAVSVVVCDTHHKDVAVDITGRAGR